MTLPSVTQAQIVAGLTRAGNLLGPGQFTYSVPGAGSVWPGYDAAGAEPRTGFAVLTAAQAADFRLAIGAWDALIAPDFVELADNAGSRGEIRIAFTAMDGAAGYSYIGQQRSSAGSKVGDIWIDNGSAGSSFAPGRYEYELMLHESGHSLGLSHSFDNGAIPAALEARAYTIMSYSDVARDTVVSFTRSGNSVGSRIEGVRQVTPMVFDIVAVQSLYGADPDTAAGDTVYRFDQAATTRQAIYDAGGTDTIDLSGFTRASVVDLRPGAYSDLGVFTQEQQLAYWTQAMGGFGSFIAGQLNRSGLYLHQQNLGIAHTTTIENAIGGSGADRLIGNGAGNVLTGGGGADTLNGGGGSDTLAGGTGDDRYEIDTTATVIREDAGEGSDSLVVTAAAANYLLTVGASIEVLLAEAGTAPINIAGNELDQTITGNDGANILSGNGGADTLNGGLGDDVYRIFTTADVIADGGGFDTVFASGTSYFLYSTAEVEYLSTAQQSGSEAIYMVGNATSQVIVGNYGANILNGRGGGNGAPDTLIGLFGDDVYGVFGQGDVVREIAGAGNDVVYANASYALREGTEIEALSAVDQSAGDAASAFTLRGNGLAQAVIGNGAANILDGRGGSDTLIGLGGADVFAFTTALDATGNVDRVQDFASGSDRIGLASDVFAGVTEGGILIGEFVIAAAAAEADDRLVYDQASGRLSYDADGSGTGAALLFAQFAAGTLLAASDFVTVPPVAGLVAG